MKSFKELQDEIVEAHQEVSADFKISASGRKVPVQRKTVKDVGDIDGDGDTDKDDEKTKKMRGESTIVESKWEKTGAEGLKKDFGEDGHISKTKKDITVTAKVHNSSHPDGAPVLKNFGRKEKYKIKTVTIPKGSKVVHDKSSGNNYVHHPEHGHVEFEHDDVVKKENTSYDFDSLFESLEIQEAVTVKKDNYSWGKMVTVHHGADTSYPLHPEHQSLIKKLKDGEKTSFRDETNSTVHAHREGDSVHLSRPKHGSTKTTVAHSHFTEEVNKSDVPAYLRKKTGDKLTLADLNKERTKNSSHPETIKKINGTQTEGCAPVAPVPDRKYIKGTPEWKANKEKNKPRTGHPTNESVELEESSKEDQRLIQLARLGLVDSSDVAKLRTAMNQLHADKALSMQQRTLLLAVFEDLIGLVTGDDQLFRRVKMDVQKEATEPKDKDDVPFDGPYTKKPSATPGKHGSGYSTARHLARLALQKQQKKPTK